MKLFPRLINLCHLLSWLMAKSSALVVNQHLKSGSFMGSKSRLFAGFGTPKQTSKPSQSQNNPKQNSLTELNNKNKSKIQQVAVPKFPDVQFPYQNHVPTLNLDYPGLRQINNDPPIYEIDNFFTPDVCNDYIQRAQVDGFEIASQTFSVDALSKRTSTTWFLKYEKTPEFISKANQLLKLPISNMEEPQIVRYDFGQQFTWHYDYIPQPLIDSSGNRVATTIVYLNDVKNGGATCFKDLNIQVKPVIGKALLFFPCYRDGKLDERMLHAGQVAMDTKWIAQMWIHEREYSPKLPPGTSHQEGIAAIERLTRD